MSKARPPSLKDVAREAGVSFQTVSRVVNDGPRVSSATRAHVLEVIARLGYHRNDAARALKTSRSRTIGVIADASPRFGPVSTLTAVESAAREAGYTALVVTMSHPSRDLVADTFGDFMERGVEGVVVIAPRVDLAHVAQETPAEIPVVVLAPGEASQPGVTVFYEDQELGARLAVRHLVELGHRDVAHLAGNQGWLDGQVRLRGWQAELRAHGIEPGALRIGDWSGDSGYEIGRQLVSEGLPGAVFVASDLMALGFIRAVHEAGLSVPGDVSVVSFDDNEFAPQVHPPLTTVRQSFGVVGSRCMEILLALISGDDVDTTPAVPELVVRRSAQPV